MPVNDTPVLVSTDPPGGVPFRFEGKTYRGRVGEPIAKALFRAGIRILSYGLKYHFPRGIHCARGRCGKCSMEVNGIPGVPTCITPLEKGMEIRREDFRPFFAPMFSAAARNLPLTAGFYYRHFTKPSFVKNQFVKNVRRMAGVGRLTVGSKSPRAGSGTEADTFQRMQSRYDIVVVGAGLSGMSAALSAAGSLPPRGERTQSAEYRRTEGGRILLVDEYSVPGGHSVGHHRDSELERELRELRGRLTAQHAIEYAPATIAQGLYPPSTLLIASRGGSLASPGRMKRIAARAFVFATGANDVLPLFENNTLPGIFGSRAIRLLLERDGYEFAGPAVVYGAGEEPVETASLLRARGVDVTAIVDAGASPPQPQDAGALPAGIQRIGNTRLVSAGGRDWIRSAVFRYNNGNGETCAVPCSLLCIAFKGQGAYELPCHAGFEFYFPDTCLLEGKTLLPRQTERSDESGTVFYLAGSITGESNWRRKMEQGKVAGAKAAAAAGQ